MNNEETEICKIYIKYAQQALIDCENMTPEEEKQYLIQKEKEMYDELEKLKEKEVNCDFHSEV